jgi:bifunctional enzyme CysN/CysC/sulfate adenylyltransferase subunit 1
MATIVAIEERLDSSTLEVTERNAPELRPTEVGTVLFALRNDIAVDLYSDNARLGRFVIEDGVQIGGGGIIREATDSAGSRAQRISLGETFIIGDEGSLVDLTKERGNIEFDITIGFLDYLAQGNRVLFRLRDISQIEPVALMAYEHNLRFTFRRNGEPVDIILYRSTASRTVDDEDDGGAII